MIGSEIYQVWKIHGVLLTEIHAGKPSFLQKWSKKWKALRNDQQIRQYFNSSSIVQYINIFVNCPIVNRNTTTNMIEDYILTKEGFDKQTIMVKEIPSEENSLKRFVLTAPIAKKDEMYKPEFWPSRGWYKKI